MVARGNALPLGFLAATPVDLKRFDYLFPALQQDPNKLLPVDRKTRDDLVRLGRTMQESGAAMSDPAGDSAIPAVYTYFGQFVDHDITFEASSAAPPDLLKPDLQPLALHEARTLLRNGRTGTLDLDSVYGISAPRAGHEMQLGRVSATYNTERPLRRPPGKDDLNDLPREPRSCDPLHDRAAMIGDPRNDENTIIAQLHVAFLRAHNEIVASGKTSEEAETILRQHYQHIVVHDFLKRIVEPRLVDGLIAKGNRVYDALIEPFFVPFEFTAAAFRFGHTMVRGSYNFNLNFNRRPGGVPATLPLLFTFTALSGQLDQPGSGGLSFDRLPENWIVEWPELIGPEGERARKFDTRLVEPLFALTDELGHPMPDDRGRLAVRNLLRGYLLRMPTGQAVAEALGHTPLSEAEIKTVAAAVPPVKGEETQLKVIEDSGFARRTPLWYYVLAEAAHGGGMTLGPVGGTLVAEVLVGLVRRSADSILRTAHWRPTLPAAEPGTFTLSDLLRFARVL